MEELLSTPAGSIRTGRLTTKSRFMAEDHDLHGRKFANLSRIASWLNIMLSSKLLLVDDKSWGDEKLTNKTGNIDNPLEEFRPASGFLNTDHTFASCEVVWLRTSRSGQDFVDPKSQKTPGVLWLGAESTGVYHSFFSIQRTIRVGGGGIPHFRTHREFLASADFPQAAFVQSYSLLPKFQQKAGGRWLVRMALPQAFSFPDWGHFAIGTVGFHHQKSQLERFERPGVGRMPSSIMIPSQSYNILIIILSKSYHDPMIIPWYPLNPKSTPKIPLCHWALPSGACLLGCPSLAVLSCTERWLEGTAPRLRGFPEGLLSREFGGFRKSSRYPKWAKIRPF